VPAAEAPNRVAELQQVLAGRREDVCIVGASANLRHLLDVDVRPEHRLTVLLVTQDAALMVLPAFDAQEFSAVAGRPPVVTWSDREGPARAVERAFETLGVPQRARSLVDDALPFLFLTQLRDRIGPRPRLGSQVLADLRARKTAAEVERIARAGALVSRGIELALERAVPGTTERALRREIQGLLREGGADHVDYVHVQAGRHSWTPRHAGDDTVLRAGEPLVLDVLARLDGYFADVSRPVFLGEAPDDYCRSYDTVRRAQQAAVAAAVVGATAHDVATAASQVIRAAGLSRFSGPRTGRGIGAGVFEAPSVLEGDRTVLAEGMVITIEPGVYVPDRFGIRFEDTVAVGAHGPRRLTHG
jgi:Xaa-Pro aminopeptidase